MTRTKRGSSLLLWLLTFAFGFSAGPNAIAQSPVCARLESQLAQLDDAGGGVSSARVAQYDQALAEQQRALHQLTAQGRNSGCGATGFLFFQPPRPASCDAIDAQIRRVESNIHRLMSERDQLMPRRAGSNDGFRRQILAALADNQCGPQYSRQAAARPNAPFGFFFGDRTQEHQQHVPWGDPYMGGTYRTLCVRTCDGYFWPISFSTVQSRFGEDEQACQRSCEGTDVRLYAHRNPGEEVDDAVSTSGAPYTALPNAFRYRKDYIEDCACRQTTRTASIDPQMSISLASQESTDFGRPAVVQQAILEIPLPRPKPGSPAAEAALVASEAGKAAAARADDRVIYRPDGRKVRVIGPGFTFYRRDEG